MPHVAQLLVGHSFIRVGLPLSSAKAESKKFLLARSGQKEALQLIKNHFGEQEFAIEMIYSPSYLKVFQPALENLAFFGAAATYQRPLLCEPAEALVAHHLCFPASPDDNAEDLASKLDLNQVKEVVVANELAASSWIAGLQQRGTHVSVVESADIYAERSTLLSAHLRREWHDLLEDVAVARETLPLNGLRTFFASLPTSNGAILDTEDNLVFNKDITLPLLNTRWGLVRWNGPWFYRLRTQWTSVIEADASQHFVTQDREVGFWPGPAVYGRSLQLTIWDLLRASERFAGDADAGVESPQAMAKVVQLLDTLGRGLTAKSALKVLEQQLFTELEMACSLAQIKSDNRFGTMAEALK